MQTVARSTFTTVKTEGAILPADLLQRIAGGQVEGLRPEDYHLLPSDRLNEAINRAWNRCLAAWQAFQEQRETLPPERAGTTLTRERWLLILFQELGYGRLTYERGGVELPDGTRYPVSHQWGSTPLHLVTFRQELDRRDPTIKRSPHSLVQELLNRSENHLWGMVSNGLSLRVLRDNVSLTRTAYLEFDLEALMTGEAYSDFSLLWLVCHQSRVEAGADPDGPPIASNCWLERWSQSAAEQGTRALDALRDGVQEAITALGQGLLAHPANQELRRRLRAGELPTQDFYRQLLRLVYQLIFLFVAEERDLLLLPEADVPARRRYTEYYGVMRLRALAERRRGGPHPDLYRALRLVLTRLRTGYAPLGLPALGSFLFSERATPDLATADVANGDLLNAIRALAFTQEGHVRRPVDYRNLGSEELGSVYESLLELHPQLDAAATTFALHTAAGSERKTTGSYYTPGSLINELLNSALEPVVAERLRGVDGQAAREQALLAIKVVDPACGSGHFLIAAASRLARRLAGVRTGDEEPSPAAQRQALRDVVRRCIYGVDINEMAVELCKVALWMETLDPGKPLGFLDANIQCGNSLIGATPALLARGIPDEAFAPLTGDDKQATAYWKKRNREERKGQLSMNLGRNPWERRGELATALLEMYALGNDTLEDVAAQQEKYAQFLASSDYEQSRIWADSWCAAFVWPKTSEFERPITQQIFRDMRRNPHHHKEYWPQIVALREQYQFFHWHLAFPGVFVPTQDRDIAEEEVTGWRGGFDVVLGNPPWEHTELKEKEWFAPRMAEIAEARTGAERKRMIDALAKSDPALHAAFEDAKRQADGVSHFVRNSGRYPLCGRGRINTYAIFAELVRHVVSGYGRAGIIVPSGIATDDTTKFYFQDIVDKAALVTLFDFENRNGIFPGVHRSYKFALLTLTGAERPAVEGATFVFFALEVGDLRDAERRFTLTAEEIALLNPNTRTCPVFRSRKEAETVKNVHRRLPVLNDNSLSDGNPYQISTKPGLFNMTHHSDKFSDLEDLLRNGGQYKTTHVRIGDLLHLPLIEAKMVDYFDHRAAGVVISKTATVRQGQPLDFGVEEHESPYTLPKPRFWVKEREVDSALEGQWDLRWLFAWKQVTSPTNERTLIPVIVPRYGVGHSLYVGVSALSSNVARSIAGLWSVLSSYICDFIARQKLGGINLTPFTLQQLPIIPADDLQVLHHWLNFRLDVWLISRCVELSYCSYDLVHFARDCGYYGPPFQWEEGRRFWLRAELDAAFFHLYGIARDDVDYIMETFPIVKRKDEAQHGSYRTKEAILSIYDDMAAALRTGNPYQTRLDPPPGDPRAAHPWDEAYLGPELPMEEWWRPVERAAAPADRAAPSPVQSPAGKGRRTRPPAAQIALFNDFTPPRGTSIERLMRIAALGAPQNAAELQELTAALGDSEPVNRQVAEACLARLADLSTVSTLEAFLSTQLPAEVRAAALRVLGQLAASAADPAVPAAARQILARHA